MTAPTFPAYPDPCGWNAMLPARVPAPRAGGAIAAKYAVVGAGYTGLAAARRLAELDPQARIVVIEATTVGEGSSARNSGFISPRDIPAGTSAGELQQAAALNRFGEEGWDWLMAVIAQHGIECGLQRSGRIKAAATGRGARAVHGLLATVRALGLAHEWLDGAALEQRIGTSYYDCGLFTAEGYLVQPAALVRGLADALPANVALHENTPLLSLRRRGTWHLRTPEAEIAADTVVLATNAAVRKFGYLRDRLVTIYTYAAISEPLADPGALGSMALWGLLPSHRLGTTVRRIGTDRLMVRSLYAHEREVPGAAVRRALLGCFHRRYPALAQVGLEHVWGGTTALTMNGAPWWGAIGDGLFASAGCNGSGVVKGTVLGKRLAEHIVGHGRHDDVAAAYGSASWVAPEPFRSIGFSLVAALERRRAGREA